MMTPVENLVHTPLAKAIGWTIFHSLWEGAAVAVLLVVALALVRSSRIRYACACLAMLGILAAFAITFARMLPERSGNFANVVLHVPPAPPAGQGSPAGSISFRMADVLPWLTPFWIAGMMLFHLRGVASWIGARRLRWRGVCSAPEQWQERLGQLRDRLRVSQGVALLESSIAEVPVVIGHLRPVILMPIGLLAGMPVGQIEAILLHELAHVARRDYLANLLQTVVEGILFYHPAAWWISSVIRTERENCCDDLVVAVSGNVHEYATALTVLAETRWNANHAVLAASALSASGGVLMKRIRRLLYPQESSRGFLTPVCSAAMLAVITALALTALQSQPAVKQIAQAQPQPIPGRAAPTPLTREQPRDAFRELKTDDERKQFVLQVQAQPRPGRPAPTPSTRELLADPFENWVNEDVAYIITNEERDAFRRLQTDDERKQFIEQFWLRRDPNPDTPENEMKDEHYRRINYANDHFSSRSGVLGWKADRGRIYITFGPPDEIDSHPGGSATKPPYEDWRYRFIQGVGNDVNIEFVDKDMDGEFHMTMDPNPGTGQRITK
jgi:GWxTD domain-containing protein